MNYSFFQKIITIFVLVMFVMPQIALAQVSSAVGGVSRAAAIPVSDSGTQAGQDEGNVTKKLTLSQQILSVTKEYGLDKVAYALSQAIGQKLANKVINKAKGGASGDSSQDSYIKNYGEFFTNVAVQDIDKYVSKLEISDNPFAQDIARSIIKDAGRMAQSATSTGDPLGAFNLDRIIGANWKDFSNDASVGGWDGILALTNPANTNIGSAMIAQQALDEQIENSKSEEILKLTSAGIKPQGKCTMDIAQYKNKIEKIKNAKANIKDNKDQIKNIQSSLQNKKFTEADITALQAKNPDVEITLSNIEKYINQDAGITGLKNDNLAAGTDIAGQVKGLVEDYGGCISELISNPTALVGEGLKIATTYGLEQTKNVDGWGEIIGGVFISLFSSFVQGGLSSLGADFQNSRSNVGGPEQLFGAAGQSVNWTRVPPVIVDLQGSLESSQENTQKEIALLQEYLSTVTGSSALTGSSTLSVDTADPSEKLLDNLTRLDQCVPGPDFRYGDRLSAYTSSKISKTFRKLSKGNDNRKESKEEAIANVDSSISVAQSELSIWTQDATRNIPGALAMLQQIQRLPSLRAKYQSKKDQLSDKQAALAMLYNIEGKLSGNMQILRPSIPSLPARIAFTTHTWDTFSAAERTAQFNWAKAVSLSVIPPANPSADTQRIFAIATAWDVWSSPENYITNKDAWNMIDPATQTSKATDFLEGSQALRDRGLMGKNEIRALYESMSDRVSIPRTLEQANLDITDLKNIIKLTADLADDCETMRSIIQANPPANLGQDKNASMIAILKSRVAEFKSDIVKQSLDLPSILTEPYDQYPSTMPNCAGGTCLQDAGIIIGDNEDRDAPDWVSEYQTPPAKSVWELLNQPHSLCTLNRYLEDYRMFLTNPTLDGGKPIECSSDWYDVSSRDIVKYFYGDTIF